MDQLVHAAYNAIFPLLGLLGLVAALTVIGVLIKGRPAAGSTFRRKGPLLSPAERSFFRVLDAAVTGDYRVFAKVRVADILAPAGVKGGKWRAAFNRIAMKHFDFVLCEPGTCSVVAVVELDDASHQSQKVRRRDQFLGDACRTAQLPIIRVRAQRAYNVDEIRGVVKTAIADQGRTGRPAVAAVRQMAPRPETPTTPTPPIEARGGVPTCRTCSRPMQRKVLSTGDDKGRYYWGCDYGCPAAQDSKKQSPNSFGSNP